MTSNDTMELFLAKGTTLTLSRTQSERVPHRQDISRINELNTEPADHVCPNNLPPYRLSGPPSHITKPAGMFVWVLT